MSHPADQLRMEGRKKERMRVSGKKMWASGRKEDAPSQGVHEPSNSFKSQTTRHCIGSSVRLALGRAEKKAVSLSSSVRKGCRG